MSDVAPDAGDRPGKEATDQSGDQTVERGAGRRDRRSRRRATEDQTTEAETTERKTEKTERTEDGTERQAATGGEHRWRAVLHRSLLLRVLGAFGLALTVAVVVMFVLNTRLTRSALTTQATRLLQQDVATVEAAVTADQSQLATGIRHASETLTLTAAHQPYRRDVLIQELSEIQRSLGLDAIAAVDTDGTIRGAAGEPVRPPPARLVPELLEGPPNRLVPLADGGWGQGALARVGSGPDSLLLIGVQSFGHAAAYELRTLVGNDVLLVVGGGLVGNGLVGSTLPDDEQLPPLPERPPTDPRLIGSGEEASFIHFAQVSSGDGEWSRDALVGVLVPDPVAQLDRDLTESRLIGIGMMLVVAALLGALLFGRVTRPLLDLARTARRIADGDLDARFATRTHDEVGFLADALEDMRQAARRQLELIREQASALRQRSRRIVEAQEEERRRLARDLHDGLQQQLVMLKVRAGMARSAIHDDAASAERVIDHLAEEIDATLEGLRATAQDIYPSILRDRGLQGALNSLAGRCPVPVDLTVSPDPLPRADETVEASAYYVVAEAVSNALKHADCDTLSVHAALGDDELEVTVRDDGVGFVRAEVEQTHGLTSMEDRCTALGGHLEVTSEPGGGTTVRARIPLGDG